MDKDRIKEQIIAEIERTRDLVVKYRDLTKPIAPENAIGRVSRIDAINNRSVNEAALRTAALKLKNLETALDRVEDPDFGYCMRCKREIPAGRLMLLPYSRTCVKCAG